MTDRSSRRLRDANDPGANRARNAALPSMDIGASALSEEEARAVLEERARILATPPRNSRGGEYLELVVVELSDETYAVESRFVFESFRCSDVAVLPGAESPIVGITAWRGELLVLLDLRRILGLPAPASHDPGQVLVLGDEEPAFGILVDGVPYIQEVPVEAVRPPAGSAGGGSGYVQGSTAEAVLVIAAADLIRTFS